MYDSPVVSFFRRLTSDTNFAPNGARPFNERVLNRPYSMRWKPVHLPNVVSAMRTSMSASRLSLPVTNDSATGSIFS